MGGAGGSTSPGAGRIGTAVKAAIGTGIWCPLKLTTLVSVASGAGLLAAVAAACAAAAAAAAAAAGAAAVEAPLEAGAAAAAAAVAAAAIAEGL